MTPFELYRYVDLLANSDVPDRWKEPSKTRNDRPYDAIRK